MSTPDALTQLREIADTLRMALQGALRASGRSPDTTGSCALAAVLVRDAVARFAKLPVAVRGGCGELGEGALDSDGTWQGHYWVEADLPEVGPVVIDITADQFGWPAPVCEPLAMLPGRYRPGDQEAIEEHMEATLEWIREGAAS